MVFGFQDLLEAAGGSPRQRGKVGKYGRIAKLVHQMPESLLSTQDINRPAGWFDETPGPTTRLGKGSLGFAGGPSRIWRSSAIITLTDSDSRHLALGRMNLYGLLGKGVIGIRRGSGSGSLVLLYTSCHALCAP